MQAFTRGSPLVSDVSRGIVKLTASKEISRISEKWVGEAASNGTRITSNNSLDVASFEGLFLIAGLSSTLALLVFSFNFLHENRLLLTSTDSTMEKLRGLARAFVMGKDKPLSPKTSMSRQVSGGGGGGGSSAAMGIPCDEGFAIVEIDPPVKPALQQLGATS